MRRNSHDMQVNLAGIRRNVKNFAHNYSDAQKKVREATSNDPWGPSSTLMAEIADLTYNVVAFSEIMQMVWKRLNDHGKNWRHVYKALVLLEYLIKTGSEKVGQQCKENIYAIQTLKDFQHLEEGKDQGTNVREKAKQLVVLLKDDERLKNERARALKAKERFAQTASAFGSDGGLDTPTSPRYPAFRGEWTGSRDTTDIPKEIEIARPQTAGEEELQLQLALAMSREEAEQEEQKRKSDDVRLQMALSQSQHDFKKSNEKINVKPSAMVDLLDVNLGEASSTVDPWGMPQPPRPQQSSPWQPGSLSSPPGKSTGNGDPWIPSSLPSAASKADPWILPSSTASPPLPLSPVNRGGGAKPHDPWSPTSHSSGDMDEFDIITNRNRSVSPNTNEESNGKADPFELNLLGENLSSSDLSQSAETVKKTPQSFLGENSALVNLDNLVITNFCIIGRPAATRLKKKPNFCIIGRPDATRLKKKPNKPPTLVANPFSEPPQAQRAMFNTQPPKPTINEIKQQAFAQFTSSASQRPFGNAAPAAAPSYGLSNSTITSTTQFPAAFGTNNGMSFNTSPAVQDPWTPMPSGATSGANLNGNSPWMRANEPANPFLS